MNRKEKKAEMMKTITELETKRNTPQPVNYVALAEHCYGARGWDHIPTLRYYMGKWYSYNDIGFEELNENEINTLKYEIKVSKEKDHDRHSLFDVAMEIDD